MWAEIAIAVVLWLFLVDLFQENLEGPWVYVVSTGVLALEGAFLMLIFLAF